MDPQKLLASMAQGEKPSEDEVRKLCELVTERLVQEPNVLSLPAPTIVVGDVHGQFFDVLEVFKMHGTPATGQRFLFLGDYVDRGPRSVLTICYLFAMKALYPASVHMLRGNHECRAQTEVYGFYSECQSLYSSAAVWRHCSDVFNYLPLAAVIDEQHFCVHGGISPDTVCIDHIRLIDRNRELSTSGTMEDLLWSDPMPDDAPVDAVWKASARGAGWQFGQAAVSTFLKLNDLQLMLRSHQVAEKAFLYHFQAKAKTVVTVWSAPEYCGKASVEACVAKLGTRESVPDFVKFKAAKQAKPSDKHDLPAHFHDIGEESIVAGAVRPEKSLLKILLLDAPLAFCLVIWSRS